MTALMSPGVVTLTINLEWIVAAGLVILVLLGRRIYVSLVTLRGYAVTPRAARVLARLVGTRDLSEAQMLAADGASERFVTRRKSALDRLSAALNHSGENTQAIADVVRMRMSDLRFADANRVPFPFAKVMREKIDLATIAESTDGPYLVDADGSRTLDVSGSYGVNVAGYDRYKTWQEDGLARVKSLGPVLGPLHPLVADNCERLRTISGLDEVSFHVSGTEAVMAAVRLARFNTRRDKIVCFSGAYHGWWDGVQPGIGNERQFGDCLTLTDMHAGSLAVIRARRKEIAAVLINPVQSFHPNSPPPNDVTLLTSETRKTSEVEQGTAAESLYGLWLAELRRVCTECDVPLLFDEVYSGFRLAPGGAQTYYGVQADMVMYGKTAAAGLPIGVICGSSRLMRRFDPDRPMRIAYVVGTFAAYPAAMGAMNEFLAWVTSPEAAREYDANAARVASWVDQTNAQLVHLKLPMRINHLGTIWTIEFTAPSRFNWLLQYYLRAEGINLSWVGTGRCLFSFDFEQEDFQLLTDTLCRAGEQMINDKWWLTVEEHPNRARATKSNVVMDLLVSLVPQGVRAFYSEVMQRKHDDHVASHSAATNQLLHLVSSSVFIYCYWLIFSDLVTAMWLGLAALFIRQIGHAIIEPPCHDAEQLLLGFDTRSKSVIVAIYLLIPAVNGLAAPELTWAAITGPIAASVAKQWFWFTALVIAGRVALLVKRHGFKNAMVWFVKLITDPFTDIRAYYASAGLLVPRRSQRA